MVISTETATATSTENSDAAAAAVDIDALVRAHLPLVGYIVRETLARVPAHVHRDDLTSAGMYGLAAAAAAFDPSHGVSFANYAGIRIRGAVTDELRSRDWLSRSVRSRAREVESVRASLSASLNRTPARDEIAAAMGVGPREVEGVEADAKRASVLSLQALAGDDGGDSFLPSSGDDPAALIVRREQIGLLRDAVAELPERLRGIVQAHFFEHRKLAEIAEELGVTESRVSQLRSSALAMLRDAMAAAELETAPAPAQEGARVRARENSRAAYYAAVAARSTVAGRLQATTLLGDPVSDPSNRVGNRVGA